MSPRIKKTALSAMSYEAALEELRAIVDKLEGGTASLEESVQLFERGQQLAKHCSDLLAGAEVRLRRLSAQPARAAAAQSDATQSTPE
jgi:exodeoxyribonuclease VII small subunit